MFVAIFIFINNLKEICFSSLYKLELPAFHLSLASVCSTLLLGGVDEYTSVEHCVDIRSEHVLLLEV